MSLSPAPIPGSPGSPSPSADPAVLLVCIPLLHADDTCELELLTRSREAWRGILGWCRELEQLACERLPVANWRQVEPARLRWQMVWEGRKVMAWLGDGGTAHAAAAPAAASAAPPAQGVSEDPAGAAEALAALTATVAAREAWARYIDGLGE